MREGRLSAALPAGDSGVPSTVGKTRSPGGLYGLAAFTSRRRRRAEADRDGSLARVGLRGSHVQLAPLEINVGPAERAELAPAEARRGGELEDGPRHERGGGEQPADSSCEGTLMRRAAAWAPCHS
jgi:hypothetical protein